MVQSQIKPRDQFQSRGIVPKKSASGVRHTDYEIRKIELSEERYAHELRRMEAEVHVESIRADIAEVNIETESNNYYRAEIERDISEIHVDKALVERDIAQELLEQAEGQLAYLEEKTDLLLEGYEEELRGISIRVDVRAFENDNLQQIAEARGIDVNDYQFKGLQIRGALAGILSGGK